MTYFHVRITPRSEASNPELELDINLEGLMERFVRPYQRGQPIVIAGRTVSSEDMGRIQINETEQDSTTLNAMMLCQQEAQRSYSFVDQHGRLRPEMLADNGEDITAKYITGPPGHEAEAATQAFQQPRPPTNARVVFVVHGRNEKAREAIFAFLRAIGLHPLEWSEAVQSAGKASPYTGEILDAAFSKAHAVVVLFTPDDEARLREPFRKKSDPSHETELTGQARPNVLFEAGMAMGRYPDRTVLVELGNLRPFSDLGGRHTIRLDNSSQRRQDLAQRLQAASCPVNLTGTDWYTTGDFEVAVVPTVQESSGSPVVLEQQSIFAGTLQLSEDAKDLLTEATKDRSRMILKTRTQGSISIQANRKFFGEMGNTRSEARWEQIIQELLNQGLIEDPKGQGKAFEVTHKGYEIVDGLETSQ